MIITNVFQRLLTISIMGTVLTLVLLGIKLLFNSRLSARWHYFVWFLLIIRLILPVRIENELSLYNLFKPSVDEVGSEIKNPDNISIDFADYVYHTVTSERVNQSIDTHAIHSSADSEKQLNTMDFLSLVWISGAFILVLVIITSNLRFLRRMRYLIPCKESEDLDLLNECLQIANVNYKIPLYISESIKTPFLLGVIKPKLVISNLALKQLSSEEKRYIFLHELMHYKRKDILINCLISLLTCLYWFNPIILYGFYKMREDCEISCDESVLMRIRPLEYSQYGKTIINLLAIFSEPCSYTCASSLIRKKSSVKRRIFMISRFKRRTLAGTVATIALTLLVGCTTLTDAKIGLSPNPETPAPTQTHTPDITDTEAIEATDAPVEVEASSPEDSQVSPEDLSEKEKIKMYLDKLKDKDYTDTYGHGYTWYTAAEELGKMGKPAIPGLIEKLDTEDDYERTLVLYALLLASQHDNVRSFTNGEYIDVNLDFEPANHPQMVEKAKAWWEKYKNNF